MVVLTLRPTNGTSTTSGAIIANTARLTGAIFNGKWLQMVGYKIKRSIPGLDLLLKMEALQRITSWQHLFWELKIFMWLILDSHPKTYSFI